MFVITRDMTHEIDNKVYWEYDLDSAVGTLDSLTAELGGEWVIAEVMRPDDWFTKILFRLARWFNKKKEEYYKGGLSGGANPAV